jgi:hypothetical protein
MITNLTERFAALSSFKKGALTAAFFGFMDGAVVTPNFAPSFDSNPVVFFGMPVLGVAAAFAAMSWCRPAAEPSPSMAQNIFRTALPYIAALLVGTVAHGVYTGATRALEDSRTAPAASPRSFAP